MRGEAAVAPPAEADPGSMTGPAAGRHVDLLVSLLSDDLAGFAATLRAAPDGGMAFLEYARRNQLAGFVHAVLAGGPEAEALPSGVLAHLAPRQASGARKRALLEAALMEAGQALRTAGVPMIVLKGPQLAARFYGDLERRAYWDLDVLVREADLATGRRVLRDLGYAQRASLFFGERISLAVVHALDYGRGEIGIDLHWKLSSHPSFRIDYARLWARRQPWESSGRRYDVLSPEYVLTLNLLSSLKDIERGALRLRSFVDLWMILQSVDSGLDWDRFFLEREEENVRLPCAAVLHLFLVLFQAANRFSRTADAVSHQHGVARLAGRDAALRLIAPTFLGPARRLWTARQYETAGARHAAWWALSLPVRLNAHKPGKFDRWSRHLRSWLRRHA